MCVSLRGFAYYGASLHISVALLFLGGFFVDLLGISEVWHNPYATYFSLILAFIYILLFLVFGLLMFRGVELESRRLLKGSVAGFIVLQSSAFIVYMALLTFSYRRKEEELRKDLLRSQDLMTSDIIPLVTPMQIIALVFGFISSLSYVAVVVTYVKRVWPPRNRN